MLGEAFFIVKIVLQRYYKFLKYTSNCLIFCKYFVFWQVDFTIQRRNLSKMYNFFKLRKSLRIKISSTITITDEHICWFLVHVIRKREITCEMADGAHVAIHAAEDMVVARAGVGGVDEGLHRFYRVLFCTKQLAVMIASMRISTKERCTRYEGTNFWQLTTECWMLLQCLIRLCEREAVAGIDAVHQSCLP